MWKCKKCGDEIIGLLSINDTFRFRIDEDKNLVEYLNEEYSSVDLENEIKENYSSDVYCCKNCGADINREIEEIAVWED